tara:strand:- start:83 stop:277 length:195 start_codon:yes stop_codon:yes gene_type:complete
MKAVHNFFGKITLATGILILMFFLTEKTGMDFPLWVKNYNFAMFGLALTVFAFTYKRWRGDDPE